MLAIQDIGLDFMVSAIRTALIAEGPKLHLFKNNITPGKAHVLADFTEADFDGYAPQTISNWVATVVSGHIAITTPDPNTFTSTGGATPNDVYGYYVTDSFNAVLWWAERDPAAPFVIAAAGRKYVVQLLLGGENLAGVP